MSTINNILSNPLIKNVALGALKKAFREQSLSMVTITLDDQDELQFTIETEPVVIVKAADLQELINEAQKTKKK